MSFLERETLPRMPEDKRRSIFCSIKYTGRRSLSLATKRFWDLLDGRTSELWNSHLNEKRPAGTFAFPFTILLVSGVLSLRYELYCLWSKQMACQERLGYKSSTFDFDRSIPARPTLAKHTRLSSDTIDHGSYPWFGLHSE